MIDNSDQWPKHDQTETLASDQSTTPACDLNQSVYSSTRHHLYTRSALSQPATPALTAAVPHAHHREAPEVAQANAVANESELELSVT